MNYLDGKYFKPALSQIDTNNIVQEQPFLIDIHHNGNSEIHAYTLSFNKDSIVRVVKQERNQDGVVVTRHACLLIVRPNQDSVLYFDPLYEDDDILYSQLPVLFPRYSIVREDYYPQSLNSDKSWCNSYVIERASAYIQNREMDIIDGEGYAKTIRGLFVLPNGDPDIEFGGDTLRNAAVGGLVGGTLGGLVGGGAGLGAGLLGGALAGGLLTAR